MDTTRRIIWRLAVIAVLCTAICFAVHMAWRLVFYAQGLNRTDTAVAFPPIYAPNLFPTLARAHEKLPFFLHGIRGVVDMLTGAMRLVLLNWSQGRSRHAVPVRSYVLASLGASAAAVQPSWTLWFNMPLTGTVCLLGALAGTAQRARDQESPLSATACSSTAKSATIRLTYRLNPRP